MMKIPKLVKFFEQRYYSQPEAINNVKDCLIKYSNFPYGAMLGNWNADPKLQMVWAFLEAEYLSDTALQRKSLYVHGTFGIGKTTLLGLIAIELDKRYVTKCEYITTGEYLRLWSAFHYEKAETYIKAPMLMLDDFGAEHLGDSEWRSTGLYDLLKHRYDAMLPTFIASNLSLKDIAERGRTNHAYSQLYSCLQDGTRYGLFDYGHDIKQTKRVRPMNKSPKTESP